ncbi:hypothetical protein HM1_0488 [Heliomicrobium modesticaldum Ice1]|uniref:Uncharacterized protein n=1 Tax=Heliobacterium modesticaldum (strain ATCC 51547 / Ice1) TaxID=498761 RepID=B0TFK3_HELMI|nr:hypothetical protein HM1_0488 [Heliomicrobium modesticaldum Ice1]
MMTVGTFRHVGGIFGKQQGETDRKRSAPRKAMTIVKLVSNAFIHQFLPFTAFLT